MSSSPQPRQEGAKSNGASNLEDNARISPSAEVSSRGEERDTDIVGSGLKYPEHSAVCTLNTAEQQGEYLKYSMNTVHYRTVRQRVRI